MNAIISVICYKSKTLSNGEHPSRDAEYTFAVENRNMTLKAYFTPNTMETDIERTEVPNEKAEVIYDLMGRRVKRAEKGLYIVNGKKVVLL